MRDSFVPLNKVIALTAGPLTPQPPLALFSGLGGKREREPSASEKSICAVPLSRYAERIRPSIHPFIRLRAAFYYL